MKEISTHDMARTLELVSQAGSIAIITHMKPDGDALGSSAGLYHFLKDAFGKRPRIVLPRRYPSNIAFIADGCAEEDVIVYEETPELASETIVTAGLIFCLDFNSYGRTEYLEKALADAPAPKILVDHHLAPDRSQYSVIFSETEVSSTAELLFHMLMKAPQTGGNASSLPFCSATALYAGMTTDTNNFANSTFPSTLMMASELIAAGVDRDMIVGKTMHSYRENRLRLLGTVLKDLMTITPEGGAVIVLDKDILQKYDIQEGDTEGFVNVPLDIASVRLSVLVKEDRGKARVSLRSKKGTSANRCATAYFRGGGHENASGGKILIPDDIKDMTEAADYATACVRKFLKDENDI